ncbi:MAG: hypothetical protein ACT6R2_16525 [Blastomonas fulva]|uniref:hypothetical protein n=1 Tax=Blastomonas fulva TaxID=1550728 RepID=UPI0040333FC6
MKNIIAYYHLFASLYYAKRNKPLQSRRHFENAYRKIEGDIEFIPAYNARILMMEGRHQEARDCLKSIVQSNRDSADLDMRYIFNYSQFHLALYEKDESARAFKAQGMQLPTSQSVKNFLPFFSDAAISRFLN